MEYGIIIRKRKGEEDERKNRKTARKEISTKPTADGDELKNDIR